MNCHLFETTQTFPVSFQPTVSCRECLSFSLLHQSFLLNFYTVIYRSFLISSQSFFSWVLGSTVRSSFFEIELPGLYKCYASQGDCPHMFHAALTFSKRHSLLSLYLTTCPLCHHVCSARSVDELPLLLAQGVVAVRFHQPWLKGKC